MNEFHLVIGAGGAQGGAVARQLLDNGVRLRGLGRRREPPLPNGAWVSADLSDRDALRGAFDGVTHVTVTLPLAADAPLVSAWAANIAEAASAARIRRLVFITSNRVPESSTSVDVFESRRKAEESLLASDVPTVVLRPPVYLENLRTPGVMGRLQSEGVLPYPIPTSHRVAWLSHDDLAAITLAALSADDVVDTAVDIGGPEAVTGPELASVFAAALGRPVQYEAVSPESFAQGLAYAIGEEPAARVADTYRWLDSTEGMDLYDGVPRRTEKIFDIRLTPLLEWIAAQSWES